MCSLGLAIPEDEVSPLQTYYLYYDGIYAWDSGLMFYTYVAVPWSSLDSGSTLR